MCYDASVKRQDRLGSPVALVQHIEGNCPRAAALGPTTTAGEVHLLICRGPMPVS